MNARKSSTQQNVSAKTADVNRISTKIAKAPAKGSTVAIKKVQEPERLTGAKFDHHKQANILTNKKKFKTPFATAYHDGSIPFKIMHGSVKHSLIWNQSPTAVYYDPLLVLCAEGLLETEHPYTLMSRLGFRDLLLAEGANDKTIPLLGRIVPPIRAALRTTNKDIVSAAMDALELLSPVAGPYLNPYLKDLMQPLNHKLVDKELGTKADQILRALHQNGGDEALAVIKTKIPTFTH